MYIKINEQKVQFGKEKPLIYLFILCQPIIHPCVKKKNLLLSSLVMKKKKSLSDSVHSQSI